MKARATCILAIYYMSKGNYMLAKTNIEKAISRYGINSRQGVELMRLLGKHGR